MSKNEIVATKQDFFLLDQPNQEMVSSLEQVFGDLITGHSEYQIKNFIIGQFLTPDRKHRQALRELYARYTGLVQQHYDAKKLQISIGRAEIKHKQAQDKLQAIPSDGSGDKYAADVAALDADEASIDLEMKRWQLENLKLQVKETLREMVVFKQELDELAPQRKYTNYEEAEAEYWQTQYIVERLSGKPVSQLPPIPNRGDIENQLKSQQSNLQSIPGGKEA